MRANILRIVVMASAIYSNSLLAAEPKFIDPDSTKYKFILEGGGCDLSIAAVKAPMTVFLNATARRKGYPNGYYVMAISYDVQVRSVEKQLNIKAANISSDTFSSEAVATREDDDAVRYIMSYEGSSSFTDTIAGARFYLNIKLDDGRTLAYVIRPDQNLADAPGNVDAARYWASCSRARLHVL